eukprot:TRINITY_DN4657_c0_g2_i2.p4 TRINITY_DN4657_c0_g2~~TRINITY_DN4657_c0_g2_i2.p4  ORF type:complete len:187 (-),score=40.61 TRINITY_DN4657_c0_g2_i2:45-605(-)
MATYANSEGTKTALIMAAGELFAEHGIDAVTVRDIAAKAQESLGIIRYHFGSKEGLVEAVMEFAGELWKNDPLGKFLEEHRYLLEKTNGQNMVIGKMVEMFIALLFSPERPSWCCTLAFQILQRDLDISRKTFKVISSPGIRAFMEVYYIVSVSYTHLRAHETSLHLVCRLLLEKKKKISSSLLTA